MGTVRDFKHGMIHAAVNWFGENWWRSPCSHRQARLDKFFERYNRLLAQKGHCDDAVLTDREWLRFENMLLWATGWREVMAERPDLYEWFKVGFRPGITGMKSPPHQFRLFIAGLGPAPTRA